MWNHLTLSRTLRQKFRIRKESHLTSRGSFSQENSSKMEGPLLTTTSKRKPLFIWYSDSEVECRSSSKHSLARQSLLMLNHQILSRISKPRFRTRKESHLISRGSFSLENSSKMEGPLLTTTSKRKPLFTWFSGSEAECRSSSRHSLARQSLLMLNHQIP